MAATEAAAVALGEDRRATYAVVGDGEPLLMFPGGPGDSAAYLAPQAALAGERFRCFLLDPHGSGGSTPPISDGDYSPEGHARFYDEVRCALGLERISVYGHSFGGGVALTYSALYPEVVDRCVCVSGFGVGADVDEGDAAAEMERALARYEDASWYAEARIVSDEWTDRVLAAESSGEVDDMMRTVVPFYFAHPERPEISRVIDEYRRTLNFDLRAVKAWEGGLYQRVDLRPLLGRIRCRTLVVAGELDFICGPAQARPIADGISGAELVVVPDCGHFPAEEAPDAFREALARV